MVKTVFILSMIVFFSATGFARDPLYAPDEYGDEDSRQVSGGSKWTSGDTFLAITLPLVVASLILLPIIFDGPDEEDFEPWPVEKFKLAKNDISMFPTRSQ